MRSPICHLESSVAGVAFNIAPECETDLVALRTKYGFVIELVDRKGFDIGIDVTKGVITLPVAALEYLWTCTYNYWVVTQEYAASQHSGKETFDAIGNPRLQAAARLVEWSTKNLHNSGMAPWPKNLPAPILAPEYGSDVHVANELFLSALGWIVHHEIGHVVLGHPPIIVSWSQQQEKDADLHATDWMLSGLGRNDLRLQKRALGVAIALLCLQSLEVGSIRSDYGSHPPAHARLGYCLERYEIGQQEGIEAFVVVILQFLFHEQGLTANIYGESFGAIFGDFLFNIDRSGIS